MCFILSPAHRSILLIFLSYSLMLRLSKSTCNTLSKVIIFNFDVIGWLDSTPELGERELILSGHGSYTDSQRGLDVPPYYSSNTQVIDRNNMFFIVFDLFYWTFTKGNLSSHMFLGGQRKYLPIEFTK